MTQKRRDNKSTEYGLWLRDQPEIASDLGYSTTNIDYMWLNYKTGLWMLKEEKRHRYTPKWYQMAQYKILDAALRSDSKYRGFHVLIFERTSPDDGAIWLDGQYIGRDRLIQFLQFELEADCYNSYFTPRGLRRIAKPATN